MSFNGIGSGDIMTEATLSSTSSWSWSALFRSVAIFMLPAQFGPTAWFDSPSDDRISRQNCECRGGSPSPNLKTARLAGPWRIRSSAGRFDRV